MIKSADFAGDLRDGWPRAEEIEHYFLAPPEQRWFFQKGTDGAFFTVEGVDGTAHLKRGYGGRADITLWLSADPDQGVMLSWTKWDGKRQHGYYSKGDLRRLRELVPNLHGTPRPVGLFIPYEMAWRAVREFLENDGELPHCIEWISDEDLPDDTFPGP